MKAAFLSSLLALSMMQASAQTFPAQRLSELDLYLSNFAEAEFSASPQEMKQRFNSVLLKFASGHAIWNNKGRSLDHPDWPLRTLALSEVEAMSQRYFGIKPKGLQESLLNYDPQVEVEPSFLRTQAKKGLMVVDGMEPQFGPPISRAFKVSPLAGGQWRVEAVEYRPSTGQATKADYLVFRCMSYVIAPNPYDAKRWSMKSGVKVSRQEMQKWLGKKDFSIPRWKSP